MVDPLRRHALRTAWLMIGAAIGLAVVLVLIGLAQLVSPPPGPGRVLTTVFCLLPVGLLGLLPGARELEVTAARTMLGLQTELVLPRVPRPAHRTRTVAAVVCHLGLGLVAAVLLVGAVPGAVAAAVVFLRGGILAVGGWVVPEVPGPAAVGLAFAAVAVCLLLVAMIGGWSARVVARLLGPTTGDRLEVALARLSTESEHTRLARELHDGIGHALTVIGLQAAAGGRVLASDPARTGMALDTIEGVARRALTELDDALGLLRTRAAHRPDEPGLDRLDALLATYRSAGMVVQSEVESSARLPEVTSATAYRVVAEGLTNAARHAGPGPVQLRVHASAASVQVRVASPLLSGVTTGSAGRGFGLTGVAERVRLFGGTSSAGPEGTVWVLRADLPAGGQRG